MGKEEVIKVLECWMLWVYILRHSTATTNTRQIARWPEVAGKNLMQATFWKARHSLWQTAMGHRYIKFLSWNVNPQLRFKPHGTWILRCKYYFGVIFLRFCSIHGLLLTTIFSRSTWVSANHRRLAEPSYQIDCAKREMM